MSKRFIGIFSALAVFFIWSGFMVFSRAGVLSGLTAFDITLLRFVVACAIVIPFARSWWPGHLPLRALVIMSLCGPGALYTTLMYLGLANSSAAYGGVFANGSLPVFTILLGIIFSRASPDRHQFIPIVIIVSGSILVSVPGIQVSGSSVVTGIVLFLCASAVLSLYIFGVKHWDVSPRQALVLVTIPNAVVYLPLWFLFIPTELGNVDVGTIVFQAAFQGLGPGFIAVILFAISANNLGPTPTAGLAAAVPAGAALLAVPVLSEYLTMIEWTGIIIVSVGLALLIMRPFDLKST